ncbi:hypothetical protein [Cryptosporangium aurantiacum]|uniref:Uncharacterized protein n=1 Tax=Cryptosporangium aurantiacum TaxID=134849 RepID=A0A1M7NJE6_9ACTN|nr:hypothetical protein [Cryptosporangium aurantiacum]SHN03988.1 hypothetical protein SAMN05443668_102677 [Cryptosporangium aurantiacum]
MDSEPIALAPAPVRRLRFVLFGQAATYGVAALLGVLAYYVRGAEHLGVGGYAAARTHPLALVILGGAAAGLLVWLGHRLHSRPAMLGSWIRLLEVVLLVDAGLAVLLGRFDVWLVLGVFAAVVVLWILSTDEASAYLF